MTTNHLRIGIFVITFTLFLFPNTSTALWIEDANFGNVQTGRTYNLTISIYSSPKEHDNHFTIEKGGDIAKWLSFCPGQFDLHQGGRKDVKLTLTIPTDAEFGESSGYIKIIGTNSSAGYTISAIADVRASVKGEVFKNVTITNFTVNKSKVERGEVVKFCLSIKNTGNCFANTTINITIYKNHQTVSAVKRNVNLVIGEEKLIETYWDTEKASGGKYTAVALINGKTSEPRQVQIEVKSEGFPPFTSVFIVVIIISLITVFFLFRKLRRS